MIMKYLLALDQGTTSSRAIVFDDNAQPIGTAQQEYEQIYPHPGHVEHNPEAIWASQLESAKEVLASTQVAIEDVVAIGITNQRETTLVWDASTGKPISNAIVWQSRITAPRCDELKAQGLAPTIQQKTGLVVDAYFSATKAEHILNSHEGLRARAERGEILFGTVDTYLIWRLSGGKAHVTDISNACRTMLYNIHTLDWDDELLKIFGIPRAMLPKVVDSSGIMAETDPQLFGKAIPIAGCLGDQQAATFGQTCFQPGDVKNTYGTGCFMLMNTGDKPVISENGLLTTIGWKIGDEVTYCLEGSIFIAGAAIQWLRDGLKMIEHSEDIEPLADTVNDGDGVYFVPAFVGLGTPHWDPNARGLIIGITRGTTDAHIARAAVDSMAYQTLDVLETMQLDSGLPLATLKVDGGASVNDRLLQFQSDLLDVTVRRPTIQETTALGAVYMAGLATGVWSSLSDLEKHWSLDREFTPKMESSVRSRLASGWKEAVRRSSNWATDDRK